MKHFNNSKRLAWVIMESIFTIFVILIIISCSPGPTPPTKKLIDVSRQPIENFKNEILTQTPGTTPAAPKALTITPTPSLTPFPTFVAVKPLRDPGRYQLADWNQQKALDTVSILNQQWSKQKQENTWIYARAGINVMKKVVALAEIEALFRYPETDFKEEIQWNIALDLATAGQQIATQYLTQLIQSKWNQQPFLPTNSDSNQTDYSGFIFENMNASNLFQGVPGHSIVKVSKKDEMGGGGGAAFSINQASNGNFLVYPIGGYWLPYWGQDFNVYFKSTKSRMNPEVSIVQWSSHGSGFYFRESWLCHYQWRGNQWVPLFTNTISETAFTFGLDFPLNQTCFVDLGSISEPVFFSSQDDGQPTQTIQVWRGLDPDSCNWDIRYSFRLKQDHYQQYARINNIQTNLSSPAELYCLKSVWDMAEIIENKKDVISFMENLIDQWPDLLKRTWEGNWKIQYSTEPGFHNQLQFQLGRFYALAGEFDKAEKQLTEAARIFPDHSDKWTFISHHYLLNIDDIRKAEEGLARDISTPCPKCKGYYLTNPVFDKVVTSLSSAGSLETVKKEIRTEVTDPNLKCYVDHHDNCAELIYLLGLSEEMTGNRSEAVISYWLVWRNYPESLYAVAAQQKLEPVLKP